MSNDSSNINVNKTVTTTEEPIKIDVKILNELLKIYVGWLGKPLDPNRDDIFRSSLKDYVDKIGEICGGPIVKEATPLSQNLTTDKNKAVQITLKATNPDNGFLVYLIVTNPTKGTISNFDGNSGTLVYTPNTDIDRTDDSFVFGINVNGTTSSKTAKVTITIGSNIITPTPTPTPQPTGNVGPDGVLQIFSSDPGANEKYQTKTPAKDVFNVSYGGGSMIKYTLENENGLDFINTAGSRITYNSGSPPGQSTRWDVYSKPGLYQNKTKYAWNNLPKDGAYLYKNVPECIKNEEFTTIVRVHGDLGTHQSYAHKLGGRNDDTIRSLSEIVHPTATHKEIQFNYNYAHFPYINVKPTIVNNPPQLKDDGKWYGFKTIHYVNPDGKSAHWESWYDDDPIDMATGKVNNKWKLACVYEDKGVKEYKNIALIWANEKSVLRIDGFKNVDIALSSAREINPNKRNVSLPLSISSERIGKLRELYGEEEEHEITVLEADPLESVEEAEERLSLLARQRQEQE